MADSAAAGLRHFRPSCLCYSPDGKTLLSWSDTDSCIRFWDAVTGREIRRIVASMGDWRINCLALSPDNRRLAVACVQGITFLLDTETAQVLLRLEASDRTPDSRLEVAFSPDGKTLAATGPATDVQLWDAKSGKPIRRLTPAWKGGAGNLAFHADGKLVGAFGQLWETGTGKHLWPNQERKDDRQVAITPDGRLVVVSTWTGLELRDRVSGRLIHNFQGRQFRGDHGSVTAMRLSPDGKRLAAIDWARTVFLWDLTAGKLVAEIPEEDQRGWPACLAFAPDGKSIAFVRGLAHIVTWNIAAGKACHQETAEYLGAAALALSPDGRWLAVEPKASSPRSAAPVLWDVAARKPIEHRIMAEQAKGGLALMANGRSLVTRGEDGLHIWDIPTGKLLRHLPLKPAPDSSSHLACSPDGKALAITDHEGKITLVDANSGKELRSFQDDPRDFAFRYPRYLQFAPDGQTLVVGLQSGVALWNWRNGILLHRLALSNETTTAAFAEDSKRLAVSPYRDQGIFLCSVATGETECRAFGTMQTGTYSSDGRFAIGMNSAGAFQLWDLAVRGLRLEIPTHHGQIELDGHIASVAFASRTNLAITAHKDGTLLLWDVLRLGGPAAGLPCKLSAKELEGFWTDLASRDAATVHRATVELAARPAQALPLLKQRLSQYGGSLQALSKLVEDLDSDRFKVRERAMKAIAEFGKGAESFLRERLAAQPTLEMARRIEVLLRKIEGTSFPAEILQGMHSFEILERLGTRDARQLLETLEAMSPKTWINSEARRSLRRFQALPDSTNP